MKSETSSSSSESISLSEPESGWHDFDDDAPIVTELAPLGFLWPVEYHSLMASVGSKSVMGGDNIRTVIRSEQVFE